MNYLFHVDLHNYFTFFFWASIFKVTGCCESKIIDFSKLVITHVCGLQSFGLHDYVCIVYIFTKSTDNLNRT